MNICVYTLGCRLNQCESEAIASSFVSEGFTVVDENSGAELYIVNTCTVTGKAEQKARRMIRLFAARDSYVVVTGCYAQMAQEELEKLSDRVLVVPLVKKAALLQLAKHINSAFAGGMDLGEALSSFTEADAGVFDYEASSFSYHSRAHLKVQDGCDNECGYCRVHVARGKSVSLDRNLVIERALELEERGFNEIVLTGVNLTMYDHEGDGLGGMMLALIPRLRDTTRLRLSSMEPDHIDEALIEACSSHKVHPHFHIPLQSASDKVLRRSNRKYSRSHLEWVLSQLRRVKDDPFIACDVIAGLPAEGEAEFRETYEFLKDNRFAAMHVFPFSPRPDTPLWGARDKAEERVRDERAKLLRELSGQLSDEYTGRQKGRTLEVLLETRKDGFWYGTTGNYLKVKVKNAPAFSTRGQILSGRLEKPGLLVLD